MDNASLAAQIIVNMVSNAPMAHVKNLVSQAQIANGGTIVILIIKSAMKNVQ